MAESTAFEHWKRAVYPRYWSRRSLHYGVDAYVRGLTDLVRSPSPSAAFELAIGNGYPFAAALTDLGISVTGCDISEFLVEECARLAPKAQAYVGGYDDATVLERLAGRQFDVVYCFRSTWYFPDLDRAIRFMRDITRPGGLVMFDIMNSDALWNQAELQRKRLRFPLTIAKNAAKAVVNLVRPGHQMLDQVFGFREILYSARDVEQRLRREGLVFRRLSKGEIERGPDAEPEADHDQKIVYVLQC